MNSVILEETKGELTRRLSELGERHRELEGLLSDPEVISDAQRYRQLLREHGSLAKFAEKHHQLQRLLQRREEAIELEEESGDEPEMQKLARQEIEDAEGLLERLYEEVLDLLVEEDVEGSRNVIMEIRAGTGGEEAALFAADLFRMYARYGEKKGWKIEELSTSTTDMGGFKEIVFSVIGQGAWQKLRYESGGHRVQRVPITESQGRIHTSLATVAVLPEAAEVEVEIDPEDLEISFMRSRGPGGQKVNKTSSCVRIVHKPTGIMVRCQDEKSQHSNRKKAMKILRARLYEKSRSETQQERDALRRSQVGSGDRNERIRTYNFPQDRITDHRIGLDVFGIENVLMGNCDEIFEKLAEHDRQERIRRLTEKSSAR